MNSGNFTYIGDERLKEETEEVSAEIKAEAEVKAETEIKPETEEKETVSLNVKTAARDAFTVNSSDMEPFENLDNTMYMPGLLTTQIGNFVSIEFLTGNTMTERNGILNSVGKSYIILESMNGDMVICDLFSIVFVTILAQPERAV